MARDFEDVASINQIRDGGLLFVGAGETEVLLFRQGARVFACGANCTHAFASLRDGKLSGTVIACARHGARFDLTTGRSLGGSCPNLPVYPVRIEGARVLVKA